MYYQVKVEVKTIDEETGKSKKKIVYHLVEDENHPGVQAQISREYGNETRDWRLVSVSETKISSVITHKGIRA